MRRTSLPPLLLLSVLAGCSRPTAPDCGLGVTVVGPTAETRVQFLSCPDGLLFAVWSDIPGATGENSSGPTEWYSLVKAIDGRAVEVKARRTAGKPRAITLNGKEYQLEDGALILVRTRGGSTKVTQIKQDLSGLPPTDETWQRLAKENTEVKDFVAQAGAEE